MLEQLFLSWWHQLEDYEAFRKCSLLKGVVIRDVLCCFTVLLHFQCAHSDYRVWMWCDFPVPNLPSCCCTSPTVVDSPFQDISQTNPFFWSHFGLWCFTPPAKTNGHSWLLIVPVKSVSFGLSDSQILLAHRTQFVHFLVSQILLLWESPESSGQSC